MNYCQRIEYGANNMYRFMASAKVLGEETVSESAANGARSNGQGGRGST